VKTPAHTMIGVLPGGSSTKDHRRSSSRPGPHARCHLDQGQSHAMLLLRGISGVLHTIRLQATETLAGIDHEEVSSTTRYTRKNRGEANLGSFARAAFRILLQHRITTSHDVFTGYSRMRSAHPHGNHPIVILGRCSGLLRVSCSATHGKRHDMPRVIRPGAGARGSTIPCRACSPAHDVT